MGLYFLTNVEGTSNFERSMRKSMSLGKVWIKRGEIVIEIHFSL
jgi:hypothetical protein